MYLVTQSFELTDQALPASFLIGAWFGKKLVGIAGTGILTVNPKSFCKSSASFGAA
jgi:hypothetical protein